MLKLFRRRLNSSGIQLRDVHDEPPLVHLDSHAPPEFYGPLRHLTCTQTRYRELYLDDLVQINATVYLIFFVPILDRPYEQLLVCTEDEYHALEVKEHLGLLDESDGYGWTAPIEVVDDDDQPAIRLVAAPLLYVLS